MKKLIAEMVGCVERSEFFGLATIIFRNGSAPRAVGAKMLVRRDGSIAGTIGGGALEGQVIQLAQETINKGGSVIREFQFSGADAASMDAICGGRVEVLVETIDPLEPAIKKVLDGLETANREHQRAWLITTIPPAGSHPAHALVNANGSVRGSLPSGLEKNTICEIRRPTPISLEKSRILVEPLNINGTAYIFGAGHVARSLAEFTHAVDFWTVVLDDRAEYANQKRFPTADRLVVLESFSNALDGIAIDQDSYLVVVTRGHQDDVTVMPQVLKTNARYIGMIGSRRKCALVFEELRRQGFSEEAIQRIHAPIGIHISAETPEEIAVSIVAELIQARAGVR